MVVCVEVYVVCLWVVHMASVYMWHLIVCVHLGVCLPARGSPFPENLFPLLMSGRAHPPPMLLCTLATHSTSSYC